MTIVQDVKPTGTSSAYVEKPFDQAKAELEADGHEIISLEQNAKIRIEQGKGSHVANYGNYVKEDFLYVPQKGIFLVKKSPIIANAKEATECHRLGREFYLTEAQVEDSLVGAHKFAKEKDFEIPTDRFAEDVLTVYAFGETAGKYGEFLKEAGIAKMPVWLANIGEKPFARKAWLPGLDSGYGSGLDGYYRSLDYDCAVRGVKFASADEGSASASRNVVNADSLKRYVEILKGVRAGTLPNSELEQLIKDFGDMK